MKKAIMDMVMKIPFIRDLLNKLLRERDELVVCRNELIDFYLTLIRDSLTGILNNDPPLSGGVYNAETRKYGWDWPSTALTMIGTKRMDNLHSLMESAIGNNIPGDFIETGVWRGGAVIYMRAVLKAYRIPSRIVWVADSFKGLPEPDVIKYPADKDSEFFKYKELTVSRSEVEQNFKKYGLLDKQVAFLEGWFRDTLPKAPIKKLALMRLDGDMYESTMCALVALYDKLSPGGYVIVDDYHIVAACKVAVSDFFSQRGFQPKLKEIDGVGVYWQKSLEDQFVS